MSLQRSAIKEVNDWALKMYPTLFPTVMVKIWDPSSFDAQSNITVCFGAISLGVLPTAFIYFLTPSNVDKLGTDIKPTEEKV